MAPVPAAPSVVIDRSRYTAFIINKNLTFSKSSTKVVHFRVVYKIYRPQNKKHPDFEFSECKVRKNN